MGGRIRMVQRTAGRRVRESWRRQRHASIDELLELIYGRYALRNVSNVAPLGSCDRVEVSERLDVFTAHERQGAGLSEKQRHVAIVQVIVQSRPLGRESPGCFGVKRSRADKVIFLQ